VLVALVKILAASAVMAAAAWGTERGLSIVWPDEHAIARLIRVMLAVSAGLATLALSARLLRLHEFEVAFGRVLSRIARRA
jgi:hypothetical protein